jgi:hypothetical protein
MKIFKLLKAYIILFVTGWHTIELTPPNKRLQVKDKNGNIAFAEPTYYPFEIKHFPGDENKLYGWRGTPVFFKDGVEKWDGGWMILCNKHLTNDVDDIMQWREIPNKKCKCNKEGLDKGNMKIPDNTPQPHSPHMPPPPPFN